MRSSNQRWVGITAVLILCAGCAPVEPEEPPPDIACPEPFEGIDRFTEVASERGLTLRTPPVPETHKTSGGSVVAQDLDGDGDIDIVLGRWNQLPDIYENDGNGHFQLLEDPLQVTEDTSIEWHSHAAVDFDGDSLPELIGISSSISYVWRNQSSGAGIEFSVHEALIAPQPIGIALTASFGDVDQDNDIDMIMAGTGHGVDPVAPYLLEGSPDLLFINEDGLFGESREFITGPLGSRTMVAHLTDRDGDSDLDLLVPGDHGPPVAFWRNDGSANGAVEWNEDAADLGAALTTVATMGIASADLNNDQRMDYCFSDVGPPTCLISLPEFESFYFEGGTALGLTVENWVDRFGTIGWSLDFNDLNNDGHLDLVQASAPDPTSFHEGILEYPNVMWLGQPDGTFKDISAEAGFDDTGRHLGLATADFDGDGWLDIIISGPDELPKLWMNRCGTGHWLGVDLIGQGNNAEGYGARVEVEAGDKTWTRELTNLRGRGQRPSRLHFGLGEIDSVDSLKITWPNGETTLVQDVTIDRWITASQSGM